MAHTRSLVNRENAVKAVFYALQRPFHMVTIVLVPSGYWTMWLWDQELGPRL
jgi:hypothetical protein